MDPRLRGDDDLSSGINCGLLRRHQASERPVAATNSLISRLQNHSRFRLPPLHSRWARILWHAAIWLAAKLAAASMLVPLTVRCR
jgi:hypothetical protein